MNEKPAISISLKRHKRLRIHKITILRKIVIVRSFLFAILLRSNNF